MSIWRYDVELEIKKCDLTSSESGAPGGGRVTSVLGESHSEHAGEGKNGDDCRLHGDGCRWGNKS